jgi:hypothetical protein
MPFPLPPGATLMELRYQRIMERSRPFLWYKPSASGSCWVVRLTPAEAAIPRPGAILQLSRHELTCRALVALWDAEIVTPPPALVAGGYQRSGALHRALIAA